MSRMTTGRRAVAAVVAGFAALSLVLSGCNDESEPADDQQNEQEDGGGEQEDDGGY